jgi:hypothetical protein
MDESGIVADSIALHFEVDSCTILSNFAMTMIESQPP